MSIKEAEEALDDAIERVETSSRDWIDAAVAVIGDLAKTRQLITSDDVWEAIDAPSEPRAMGAALRQANRLGYISPTDMMRKSRRKECHRRPLKLWRSLIFEA